MKKHYFLGTAAGWSRAEIERQRREAGTHQDTLNLYHYLFREYGAKQAIITRNGRSAIAAALDTYHLFEWVERPPVMEYPNLPYKELMKKQAEYEKRIREKYRHSRGEIIINGLTCRAVVQGVEAAKFTPVYADIDRKTLNFTVETLEKVVTPETKAVIVQNTLGNMVDIRAIEQFCKKHGLTLIEDLAHCVGRFYPDGREAGKVGEIVVFSFGKEKSIDVVNGGAVGFRNRKIFMIPIPQKAPPEEEAERARMYPTYGLWYRRLSYVGLHGVLMRYLLKTGRVVRSAEGEIDWEERGLSDWQAKLALEKLKKRRRLAEKPLREFYLVRDRALVLRKLRRAGYYFDGVWYDKPVGPARYYAGIKFPERECPVAVEVAERIVNLPNYYSAKELAPARKIIEKYAESVDEYVEDDNG